jgi:hypothetical protein
MSNSELFFAAQKPSIARTARPSPIRAVIVDEYATAWPFFWRSYYHAQFNIAARSTQRVPSGIVRRPSVQEVIADYEKTKKPAAANFVRVGRM